MDIFDKCEQLTYAQQAIQKGLCTLEIPIHGAEGPLVSVNGRDDTIMLCGNSYLGLSTDPDVVEASVLATQRYGVGTSGSPMLNGTRDLHVELEKKVARLMGKESAALFSTGYQTNVGTIAAIVNRGDYVIADYLAHASLQEGCRLSGGKFLRFQHNDMASLEAKLQAAGDSPKLVVVDGVYSMDGDLCNLPQICSLAKQYGARILLDDAHGFGVVGRTGRGTIEHFDLFDSVDLIVLTFSKALGAIGGCVIGDDRVIQHIKHKSKSFIFCTSTPPSSVGAVLAALDKALCEQEGPLLRQQLSESVRYFRQALVELGFNVLGTDSHIIPIEIGDEETCFRLGQELLKLGVFVATVPYPAVPIGRARLRATLSSAHSKATIDRAIDSFASAGRTIGLLKGSRDISAKVPHVTVQANVLEVM